MPATEDKKVAEPDPVTQREFPPIDVITEEILQCLLTETSPCDPHSYEQAKRNTAKAYAQLYKKLIQEVPAKKTPDAKS